MNHTQTSQNGEKITLPKSLQYIIESIESSEEMSTGKLKKIVREAQVTAEDLMPWSDFDHPLQDGYGRNMVYDGGFFDIMVMSWNPGDFSGIHDHGYTMWGTVQVFGKAEHAIFLAQDGEIRTLSRNFAKAGQIIGVGHELVHQMGNSEGEEPYLSLHIYGNFDRSEAVTADARIFDFYENKILRTSGGAFLALPETRVLRREEGPCADYITWLRNTVEVIRQIKRAKEELPQHDRLSLEDMIQDLYDLKHWNRLIQDLEEHLDENGHHTHSQFWKLLSWELKEAAKLQKELREEGKTNDSFHNYASVYDEIIGKPCLDNFIGKYLRHVKDHYALDFQNLSLLSIGCGTGLMERFMIKELGFNSDNLLGIDLSEAMIKEASKHIRAEVGDALELDPAVQMWDLTYCGLNVFQYVDHQFLENVIRKAAQITNSGGYFFGDFITPDHIRWYPNTIFSNCGQIASLRSPRLIEKDNHTYQRSSIINVNKMDGKVRVTYEGEHDRFLPPMNRVRDYFIEAFGGQVDVYDAASLTPISENEDTCPSTRYLLVAQKA